MYPLDSIYGPKTYREFALKKRLTRDSLKATRQTADEAFLDEPLMARSYAELLDIVSFLGVMNKRHTLYFRGQGRDRPLLPAIFRDHWVSLSGNAHELPASAEGRAEVWRRLNDEITQIVHAACDPLPMPRRATLQMFREAVWAVAQHYELWPTPLIDITPNLRIAASFALFGGRDSGYVYVAALPASTNSVTFDADQHVVLARLQAVCPPVAKRPHYQDGFLAGRFPFESPNANRIDSDPGAVSKLSRRVVAKVRLEDPGEKGVGGGFWNEDFPPMSRRSLLPEAADDQLLAAFLRHADEIDAAMAAICKAGAFSPA